MEKRNRIMGFVVSTLAIAAIAGAAFTYQTVSAQGITPTPEAPEDTAPQQDTLPPGKRFEMRVEVKAGEMQEDLAAALGMDLETLEAAQQEAAEEALAQAVEQGLITQAQADRMLERGFARGGRFAPHVMEINGIDYDALLAGALNITVEALEDAREEAFTIGLERAVSEDNLTQEQADLILGRRALFDNEGFQTSMQTAFESAVQQAVTDGVITQAQADAILQGMEDRGGMFERRGFGSRGFFRRGFGGRLGGGDGGFPFPLPELPEETMPSTDA